MIRWPWTSAARLDYAQSRLEDAFSQIGWLRRQNQSLTDQLVRVQRHQVGLHETPREPRPAIEPMPKPLHDYIKGFANKSIQKAMRDAAYKRHAQGEPWNDILEDTMRDEPEPEGAEE